ncbi:MAG: uroporphyrinogen-III synthase [Betaproteobacteria bacterium]|nr:uroporphyrinogen-III synthase [Betaproteobacteria bacterium]
MAENGAAIRAPSALAGWTVILTRPAHSAQESVTALEAAGARVMSMPVLSIEPIDATLDRAVAQAAHAAVFVSANAVAHGLARLRALGLSVDTPCFAVGEATASALRAAGQVHVAAPQHGFDSEHLLALPALNSVAGQTIMLVKGQGRSEGRALIEATLAARGARVVVFACYRRRALDVDEATRKAVLAALDGKARAAVVVASVESLEALAAAFADARAALARAVLAVPHLRVANAAHQAGFTRTRIVPLSAAGLVQSLAEHAASMTTG